MDRFPFDTDDRDALTAELTEQRVRSWKRLLEADNKRARSDLHNVVLDHMATDGAKDLIVRVVLGEACADEFFALLPEKALREACEKDAKRAVGDMERGRKESADDNRIAQAELARLMH